MILLGSDWYELIRSKMETVEAFILYSGSRPPTPDIIPWLAKPSGVINDATLVPQTPTNYSVISHNGLSPFYRTYRNGKVHVSLVLISHEWHVKVEKLSLSNNSFSSESVETMAVDNLLQESATIIIKEVEFTPDGRVMTVLTSRGEDVQGNNQPAKMFIYTLQEPFTLSGAVLYSEQLISSGAGFLDGLPYPSNVIWSSGGNIAFILSNNTIYKYFLLNARDFRTSVFGSTNVSFNLDHIGNIHSLLFIADGTKVLMLEGGYNTDSQGNIIVASDGSPVWTPPRLVTMSLAEAYNPFTIINAVEDSFELTYLFSQYQNDELLPNLFYMSIDEDTNYLYISGVDGINGTKTVVLEMSSTTFWDAGASNGESDLIVDLSSEFGKISITQEHLLTNFTLEGLTLYLDRKPHEIVKKQVERAGVLSFFYLKTQGIGGSLWVSGNIGLIGSGADIEVNRVVVAENDQINLNNLEIKFSSIRI